MPAFFGASHGVPWSLLISKAPCYRASGITSLSASTSNPHFRFPFSIRLFRTPSPTTTPSTSSSSRPVLHLCPIKAQPRGPSLHLPWVNRDRGCPTRISHYYLGGSLLSRHSLLLIGPSQFVYITSLAACTTPPPLPLMFTLLLLSATPRPSRVRPLLQFSPPSCRHPVCPIWNLEGSTSKAHIADTASVT